jgi:hypothetical protein
MDQQLIAAWTWVGFKLALAIIAVANVKRILVGFVKAFGPDGIDKKELFGISGMIAGYLMLYADGTRPAGTPQLFSEWTYAIVFGLSALALGIKDVLKLFALRTGNIQKDEAPGQPVIVDPTATDQAPR